MGSLDVLERCVAKSAILSRYQMPQVIALADVIRTLNAAKISFVLVGAHGLAGWRKKPRATEDVDVVVASRQLKKAVTALTKAFPSLEPVDSPVVIRLRHRESQDIAIDVMKPVPQPYREVFKHTCTTTVKGQKVRIPSLEMALVMKFSAMSSLYRADEDRHLDAHDFILMVKQNAEIDRDQLGELGSLLYPNGGKDVQAMVDQVLRGESLKL